jgi:selenide,water dikinase
MRPPAGVHLTLVVDRAAAVYSGMVPGCVAGDYRVPELEIDVVPLARRARARVILAAACRVDAVRRRIAVGGRPELAYDVASLDVGSSVFGLDLPGVRAHALATRPIRDFVDGLEVRLSGLRAGGAAPRIAVVGGGAAGMELAFTLQRRLAVLGRAAAFSVLFASDDVLPGAPARVARRVRREAERRGIALRPTAEVTGVRADGIELADGSREPSDLTLWATGAAPPPLLAASALPLDAAGFLRVRPTLQVVGHDDLYAAGDCASLDAAPWVPKAGVYAVREGAVLIHNLRARLAGGGRLRRYRPQRDFLTLLNLGGRRALGAKWGAVAEGGAVWRLKDRIDRRFVRRFQVLDEAGVPTADFPSPAAMGMEPMACGGCAAKVGASPLARALARLDPAPEDTSVLLGLARPDDAAALALPGGEVLLASVDGFRAFADDPWLVGRVAAVNAASDVYAKGGAPRHALALVCVPEDDPARAEELLLQVLAGVRAGLDPLGISLVGGHSTCGDELFVGLTISGQAASPEALLRLDGLRPGQALILSKPLGTGVVLAADMQGLARGDWWARACAQMLRANAAAAGVARAVGASACTDVSGFGLAGHLGEMLRASGCAAAIRAPALPALPGALDLLSRGLRSSFHAQNAEARRTLAVDAARIDPPRIELCFDPQTSGGLLFGVAPERSGEALAALREAGDVEAALIGEATPPRPDGALLQLG